MNDTNRAPTRAPHTNQDAPNFQVSRQAQELCRLEQDATVTADAQGRITDYSAAGAHLLGRQVDNLIGKPLSQFLDRLPFDHNTPGYNLAYTVFHGAGGRWQQHRVATPDGLMMGVDVALSSVRMKGRRAIQITLKATDSGQQAHCH